ncbi:hypothetical protein UlMin_038078 [Ulmus minor]
MMGFSLTLSVSSPTSVSNRNFIAHHLCSNAHKSFFFRNPQINKPITEPIKRFQSSKSSEIFPQLSHRPVPVTPLSKVSIFSHFPSPKENLHQIFSKKFVGFLIGTVFFVGCFNIRAAVALPAQTSSSSANLEEKSDTQKGEYEDEKLLERNPRDVEALKVILYGKMRRGKTKEAVKYVERLIALEPKEVEWKLLRALCYEMMGELSIAKTKFKEILKERPLLLRALHGLALVMHKNREGPAVFEMLEKALEIARREKRVTEERNIRILIAQMHVVRGELEMGLEKFQTLVEEDHRDFRPYLCMGIIYSLLDKKKEAAEQFETFRALVPEEFPQRGFLDDVVLAAKTKSQEQLQKEFGAEYSN